MPAKSRRPGRLKAGAPKATKAGAPWVIARIVFAASAGFRAKISRQPEMTETRISSFADFWPFYVRAHSKPRTRVMHAIGSTLALACVALGIAVNPWFFLAAPIIGYAFAWYGHFFIEHNKPATFGHPFYSLAADYVMVWKMLTGRMRDEVARHAR
jgi:hypothetical protein